MSLRVFVGKSVAAASTSDLSPESVARLVDEAVSLARITSPDEIDDLGLRELVTDDALLLVEWPSRAAGRLGVFDLVIRLDYARDAEARRMSTIPGTPRGASVCPG